MVIFEKIKKLSYTFITLGKLSEWKTGGIIGSLLAFPLIFLGILIHKISPTIFYWSAFSFLIFSFLLVYLSLGLLGEKGKKVILWDKVIGMIFCFLFIPLKWKIFAFGFLLFHIINYLRPILFCKVLGQKIDNLPAGTGIILGDIVSGLICNIFLHLIVWVIY